MKKLGGYLLLILLLSFNLFAQPKANKGFDSSVKIYSVTTLKKTFL